MKKDPLVYLKHIRDAIECITEYTSKGEQFFFSDEKTQDAVILNIAIIGEATKKLPSSLKEKYPKVPWKNMAGTRDILIHDYDSTEIKKVWNIIKKDIPSLKKAIIEIIELLESSD